LVIKTKYKWFLKISLKSLIFNGESSPAIMNRIKNLLDEKGIKQTCHVGKLGKSFKMVNTHAYNRKQPSLETLFGITNILLVNQNIFNTRDEKSENYFANQS
jgi:putative transcriptional regulator